MVTVAKKYANLNTVHQVSLWRTSAIPPNEDLLPTFDSEELFSLTQDVEDISNWSSNSLPSQYFNVVIVYNTNNAIVGYGYEQELINLATIKKLNIKIIINQISGEAEIVLDYIKMYDSHKLSPFLESHPDYKYSFYYDFYSSDETKKLIDATVKFPYELKEGLAKESGKIISNNNDIYLDEDGRDYDKFPTTNMNFQPQEILDTFKAYLTTQVGVDANNSELNIPIEEFDSIVGSDFSNWKLVSGISSDKQKGLFWYYNYVFVRPPILVSGTSVYAAPQYHLMAIVGLGNDKEIKYLVNLNYIGGSDTSLASTTYYYERYIGQFQYRDIMLASSPFPLRFHRYKRSVVVGMPITHGDLYENQNLVELNLGSQFFLLKGQYKTSYDLGDYRKELYLYVNPRLLRTSDESAKFYWEVSSNLIPQETSLAGGYYLPMDSFDLYSRFNYVPTDLAEGGWDSNLVKDILNTPSTFSDDILVDSITFTEVLDEQALGRRYLNRIGLAFIESSKSGIIPYQSGANNMTSEYQSTPFSSFINRRVLDSYLATYQGVCKIQLVEGVLNSLLQPTDRFVNLIALDPVSNKPWYNLTISWFDTLQIMNGYYMINHTGELKSLTTGEVLNTYATEDNEAIFLFRGLVFKISNTEVKII